MDGATAQGSSAAAGRAVTEKGVPSLTQLITNCASQLSTVYSDSSPETMLIV